MNSFNYHELYSLIKPNDSCYVELHSALKQLLKDHDFYTNKIKNIDYKNSMNEYSFFMKDKKIYSMNTVELDVALIINEPNNTYLNCFVPLNETNRTLDALKYIIRSFSLDQILMDIQDNDWLTKHEIITRWLWMTEQKKEITKGKKINYPFLCRVGRKNNRKTLDREFFTYLIFAPSYNKRHQNNILLQKKGEHPDFIALDNFSNQIELEITEAIEDEKSPLEEKKWELLIDKINKDLKKYNLAITVITRPSWSFLLDNYDTFKEWLNSVLKNQIVGQYTNKNLHIFIDINKNDKGITILDMSGDGSGMPSYGYTNEQKVSESIILAINKKLKKEYTNNPVLVIYYNTGFFDIDFKIVVSKCQNNELIKFQKMFSEIWIATDKEAYFLV
ncbi:MAG TPA: hypothetical protein PLP19_05145 [bacterium]|nr:hypothetical protein [bacterium]HPN42856.1 hypothetical protein [bacterium]